ncbi:uncharacterized protein LOC130356755 [Hyla sarda]|uniref:uncharacterized protein LOC130356755 n=1 Tax=Hyla sarda TaxID=327740 RepID=UPI0024C2532B|nr:uncharacterized protein LOC130356755 [Hyla sarda]
MLQSHGCEIRQMRGFDTLMDCRHGGTILVNHQAVQRDYLSPSLHSLESGEIVEYTPVQSMREEWAAEVTCPKNATQVPFAYFPLNNWDPQGSAGPFGLLPPRVKGTVHKEEIYMPEVPAMAPKYLPKSSVNVPRATPVVEEVWPNQRAPTEVPRPIPAEEVWSSQQAPTAVPPVAQAAAVQMVVTISPTITGSTLSRVNWNTRVSPLEGAQSHGPCYKSQPRKQFDRRGWDGKYPG